MDGIASGQRIRGGYMTNRTNGTDNRLINFILVLSLMASTILTGCSVSISNVSDSTDDTAKLVTEDGSAAKESNLKDKVLTDLPTGWDLTCLYADEEAFEADMKEVEKLIPKIEKLRGTLNSVDGILNDLENPDLQEINKKLYRGKIYLSLLSALDASDPRTAKVSARLNELIQKVHIAYKFEDAEISKIPLEKRIEFFSDEKLAPYAFYMRKYTDPNHVFLSEEEKSIKSIMDGVPNNRDTYNIFNNVDLPIPTITYPDGTEAKLTDSEFNRILQSEFYDRDFRKEASDLFYSRRAPYVNTFASLLEGEMRKNVADARINGYSSALESALDQSAVDPKIYYRIIEFSHDMLPKLHEYYETRKELLGLDEMMTYDNYESVTDYTPKDVSYEEAVNIGRAAIAVWGDEYLEKYDEIIQSPHIDVYPADKKQGGAFSLDGFNATTPFVMFNFDGKESYISSIDHEMGHAVYEEFSSENQPLQYCHPDIFTDEIASTANEILFHKYMIKNAKTDAERIYWLDDEIRLFYKTLFRQCMFAEFEDYCYKTIENGGALSAGDLNAKYLELMRTYYGNNVNVTDDIGTEWARVHHFFMNYYVYKYATSITYAASICDLLEDKGQDEIDAYMGFLKAGSSADPATLLSMAGVNPLDDVTYDSAKELIDDLIDEYVAETRKLRQ